MATKNLSIVWLLLSLLGFVLGGQLVKAEIPSDIEDVPVEKAMEAESKIKIPPGARELAHALGVEKIVDEIVEFQHHPTNMESSAQFVRILGFKEELMERVLATMLEVRGVSAQIRYEITQNDDLRAYLESRRDRAIKYNSIANAISGLIAEGAGNSLGIASKTNLSGEITEITGGVLQSGLSFLAIHQGQGEKRKVVSVPNMLAKLFDRPVNENTDYPKSVWDYLNGVPPGAPAGETRKTRLIKRWIQLGLLGHPKQPSWRLQVERATSTSSSRHSVDIDLLANRAAMLNDLEVIVQQMERGLLELILLVRSRT